MKTLKTPDTCRIRYKENTCQTCGKVFHPWSSVPNQHFCSNACYWKSRKTFGSSTEYVWRKVVRAQKGNCQELMVMIGGMIEFLEGYEESDFGCNQDLTLMFNRKLDRVIAYAQYMKHLRKSEDRKRPPFKVFGDNRRRGSERGYQ